MQENTGESTKHLFQLLLLRKERMHLQAALSTGERHRGIEALPAILHFLSFCQLSSEPLNVCPWALQGSPSLDHTELPSTHLIPRPSRVKRWVILATGPSMPHSSCAYRDTWRGPLWLLLSLAVKAHGRHEAVLQGLVGLDKVKTVSLQLNSDPMWAILLLLQIRATANLGILYLILDLPHPIHQSGSHVIASLRFLFSNLFQQSIWLVSVSWLLSWVAHSNHNLWFKFIMQSWGWRGIRRNRDVLCCCSQQSGPCFLLCLPYQWHLHPSRLCHGNPSQWNDCQGV